MKLPPRTEPAPAFPFFTKTGTNPSEERATKLQTPRPQVVLRRARSLVPLLFLTRVGKQTEKTHARPKQKVNVVSTSQKTKNTDKFSLLKRYQTALLLLCFSRSALGGREAIRELMSSREARKQSRKLNLDRAKSTSYRFTKFNLENQHRFTIGSES